MRSSFQTQGDCEIGDQNAEQLNVEQDGAGFGHFGKVTASSSKATLKRGRTIGILDEIHQLGNPEHTKLKRRKSMAAGDDYHGQAMELGELPFENSYHPNSGEVLESMDFTIPLNSEIHQDTIIESSFQPVSNTLNYNNASDDSMRPLDIRGQSQKNKLGRSKSMLLPTDSPPDTEPMSSTTFARARRTLTNYEGQPPASSANSVDELALPVSVQTAVNKFHRNKKQSKVQDINDQSSEQDGLASDDFGGMPKEMYKPRPSRSRVKRVEEQDVFAVPNDLQDAEPNSQGAMLPILLPNSPDAAEETVERTDAIADQLYIMDDAPASLPKPEILLTPAVDFTVQADVITPQAQPSKKERKTSKKKKLKRGKTTSVILRKTVDSDVEDDVIWVDERPVTFPEKEKSPELSKAITVKDESKLDFDIHKTDSTSGAKSCLKITAATNAEIDMKDDEASVPAPKKRVRKPKKKTDTIAVEIPVKSSRTDEHQEYNETQTLNEAPIPESLVELDETAPPQLSPEANAVEASDDPVYVEDMEISPEKQEPKDSTEIVTSTTKEIYNEKENQRTAPQSTDTIQPSSTPKKSAEKGPDKHSPITVNNKVTYRVGLSRKARIAPLLKVIRK